MYVDVQKYTNLGFLMKNVLICSKFGQKSIFVFSQDFCLASTGGSSQRPNLNGQKRGQKVKISKWDLKFLCLDINIYNPSDFGEKIRKKISPVLMG